MATIGEDAFITGLRDYVDQNAFGNTDFADLLVALERAGGRELGAWTELWLATTGISTLRVDGGELRQISDVLRPHRIDVGCYDRRPGALVLRERSTVELVDAVTVPSADLVLPDDTDLTYAKIRLDDRSLATALTDVGLLDDPRARAMLWGSLWDACRDGQLPVRSYVDAVLDGIGAESDASVVTSLLDRAVEAATLFCPDGAELRQRLARASWSAQPGGDLQLARVRAWARMTHDGDRLRGLLDATAVPDGLVVDAELRWHVVDALAVLGEVDEAEIDAELRRDDTAAGRRHALRARAGLPDPGGKARAWAAASRDTSLSNHESRAWAAGFWRVGQDELLAPYVRRYAEEIPGVFGARSPEVGRRLASELFPRTVIAQSTFDSTARLEAEIHPGPLRRIVAERRDDLARALRVRSVNGA